MLMRAHLLNTKAGREVAEKNVDVWRQIRDNWEKTRKDSSKEQEGVIKILHFQDFRVLYLYVYKNACDWFKQFLEHSASAFGAE